jgi:acyl CoA:acetate/3-ketoacid CoA transferase alpha subunit
LREFIKDKPAIYFLATEENEAQIRDRFRLAVAEYTGSSALASGSFDKWEPIFDILLAYKPGQRKILVIDEFPYAAAAESAIKSFLQHAIDLKFKNTKLFIILSGSHIGFNPEATKASEEGWLELEFYPQGSYAEAIRCAGAGLGGVLTKTGLGTVLEERFDKITVDGEDWLLIKPLRADIGLIKCHKADEMGNLVYRGVACNFNHVMAMAADVTVVECDEIVSAGEIPPNQVYTPGAFVDYILEGGSRNYSVIDGKPAYEKRTAEG